MSHLSERCLDYADRIAYYVSNNNMGYDGSLELLSIGLVNDMHTESRNDETVDSVYSYTATQSEMDCF